MAAIKVSNHQFFSRYKATTIAWFAVVQLIGALMAGILGIWLWQSADIEPTNALIIAVIALVIINSLSGAILFAIASQPLKLLAQAVAHVSNDPVVTQPPELSAKKYERSGLTGMVQTVYSLAASSGNTSTPLENVTQVGTLLAALAKDMPAGLVALAKDGSIMYANTLAPVADLPDGGETLTLQFEQSDTLADWLKDSDQNKVRDTRMWQRIADKLPGEDKRRIFDVAAYYQKDSPAGIAVILVAFDRTSVYQKDQEDMDFIALAAHELRGPITIIRGYLDVMQSDLRQQFTPDQQELFDRLQVSSERLAGYVNNILNVSRYDRHQFKLHLQSENLVEILKTLLPDLTLRARTVKRRLTFRIPAGLPNIAADRSGLGEVVTNLVDNAIKYSHIDGEIVVAARFKQDTNQVEVTVQDFGIGIPASVVGDLFNKFYRSHLSRKSVGGTGLGLYICKAIVEAHGGNIWVSSEEGTGSTFGFTVPTYDSVAANLQSGDNQTSDIVQRPEGWIKNHAMYRR